MTLKAAFFTFMFCLACAGCGSSGSSGSSNNNDNGGNGGNAGDGGNGDEAPFRNIGVHITISDPYGGINGAEVFDDEPIPYVVVPPYTGNIFFTIGDWGEGTDVSEHEHQMMRIDPDTTTHILTGTPFITSGISPFGYPFSDLSYTLSHTFTLADNGVVFVLSVTPDSGIVETTTEDNVASLRVYVVDPDGDG